MDTWYWFLLTGVSLVCLITGIENGRLLRENQRLRDKIGGKIGGF